MKKHIIIILIMVLAFVFMGASCESNRSTVDYNNTLNIVHICDMGGNCTDYEIQTWYDNQGSGIGFATKDGNYIWCSEGTYIMASEYCPICGRR